MFAIDKITDKEYFKRGDIWGGFAPAIESGKDLVVSASLLKSIFSTNLYHKLVSEKEEITPELQTIFDVGSAFHCYVLERRDFDERYQVTDDLADHRTLISKDSFEFIKKSEQNVFAKYPEMLDQEFCELAIFGELDGVKVKCKIDKMNIKYDEMGGYKHIDIVDLKSVYYKPFAKKKSANGDRYELRRELSSMGYDLQAYFYKLLVEKWCDSLGMFPTINFVLLTASREDCSVQKFTIGDEMMASGESKFDSVWSQVVSFVNDGTVEKEEIL